MSYNSEIQAEAALAQAKEQHERTKELDSQGLCHDCGEAPKNPFVRAPLCLNCYRSSEQVGCDKSNCPNPHYGSHRGSAFCKAHLTDAVHSSYYRYLDRQQELDQAKRRFDEQVQQVGEHPREFDCSYDRLTDPQQDVFDRWVALKHQAKRVNFLKKEIKQTMMQDIQFFPDEYKVFG